MPNWNEILNEIQKSGSTHDIVRRNYIRKLNKLTGRNVIVYYSGWLQKTDLARQGFASLFSLTDADKTGFMSAIDKLDRSKGLDLVLHTPGGNMAATESLVSYLREMFGTNIRAIVPQLAMSAGTLIACSCKEIIMGKHSSLGPIDPQLNGLPAHGIKEEFERAKAEVGSNPSSIPLWQQILSRYHPTLIGEAEKAITWSEEMVQEWLKTGMFSNARDKAQKAERVKNELSDHALTKSHDRHISYKKARDIGLKVSMLEDDDRLQEAILSVHHACIHTLTATAGVKIIENQKGTAFIQRIEQRAIIAG